MEHSNGQASVAELVKRLTEQTSRLAHQEVELAKAELALKGKRAGLGAGMFGGAGLFGMYALGALVTAAILALAHGVASWLAALIVAGVLALVAGVVALVGARKVRQAVPPIPEQTVETVREDLEYAKAKAQAGRAG
jgi:MFS family permease